jgi:hypothetical protein
VAVAAIDTHEVAKELMAAGFTDGQTEAVSRVVRQARIVAGTDLAELKVEILKWAIYAAMGAQAILVSAAAVLLTRWPN